MPLTHAWNKGTLGNGSSAITGIFPNALACNFKIVKDVAGTIAAGDANTNTGIFIPFSDLTGIDNTTSNEIGHSASASADEPTVAAGGSRFMLAVMEAAFAAQENATGTKLKNCVVTRSSLSVVDEDTLQKTFTVKFKLSHSSQEIEAE